MAEFNNSYILGHSSVDNNAATGSLSTCNLEIYHHDVVIRPQRQLPAGSSKRRTVNRGRISEYSEKSQRNLRNKLRNCPSLKHWIVLTYPDHFPPDAATLKKHTASCTRYFRRLGLSGYRVTEFQERSAPHLNFVIDGDFDRNALRKWWFTTVDSGDLRHYRWGRYTKAVYDNEGLAWYLQKPEQKEIPEQYSGIGRLWSHFGLGAKSEPVAVISGSTEEIQSLFAECLAVENERRASDGYYQREYAGVYSCKSYKTAPYLRNLLMGEAPISDMPDTPETPEIPETPVIIANPRNSELEAGDFCLSYRTANRRLSALMALWVYRNMLVWLGWLQTLRPG